MVEARPFPFDKLPRVRANDARATRRCASWLPLEALAALPRTTAEWLGASLSLEALPLERCGPGELHACVSDPLCAAILEPAAPLGARIALEMEPRFAAVVIERVLGGTGDDAALHPGPLTEAERGVLAYAIARMLASHAGGELRLAQVVTTPEALLLAVGDRGAFCWPMRAQLGGHRAIVRAWIPSSLIDGPEPARAPGAHAASLGALEGTVVVEIGRASLVAKDVGALAPGDVVVLDRATARPAARHAIGEALVRVRGGTTRWRCALESSGDGATRLVMRARERGAPEPMRGARKHERKQGMSEHEGPSAQALLEAAGDAPVELVVELARFEMPLGELAALRPGEVLATGKALGERVVLRAGDRTVALGELVEIEGEIGVRVLALG